MKVLFFCPRDFIGENTGATQRIRQIMFLMHSMEWKITVITFGFPMGGWKNSSVEALAKYGVKVKFYSPLKNFLDWMIPLRQLFLSRLFGKPPDLNAKCPRSLSQYVLNQKNCNVIWVNFAFWAKIAENYPGIRVLDTHDFLTSNLMQKYGSKNAGIHEYKQILRDEIKNIRIFDHVLAISQNEQARFSRYTTNPVMLLPPFGHQNFIDPRRKIKWHLCTVASGSWNNVTALTWFLKEVFPLIRREFPDVRMLIMGKVGEVLQKRFSHLPVEWRIYVPNLRHFFNQSGVFISVFSQGTGLKMKVFDALRHGMVVTGNRAGFLGFDEKSPGMIVQDTPKVLARDCVEIISNDQHRISLESSNRKFFLSKFSINHAKKVMQQIQESVR